MESPPPVHVGSLGGRRWVRAHTQPKKENPGVAPEQQCSRRLAQAADRGCDHSTFPCHVSARMTHWKGPPLGGTAGHLYNRTVLGLCSRADLSASGPTPRPQPPWAPGGVSCRVAGTVPGT